MIQGFRKETMVNDLFLLSDRQMARIEQYFPLARGIPRVDEVYVIKRGLQWKDARNDTARTRHSTIALSAGAGLVYSTVSSQH